MKSEAKSFWHGAADILPLAVSAAVFGAVYGMTSRRFGFPLWSVAAMSLMIFAGSSQFMAANVLYGGAGPLSTVATIGIVNLRMLLLSTALNERVKDHFSLRQRLAGAFFLTDESFVTYYGSLGETAPSAGRYMGASLCIYIFWICSCVAGFQFGAILPERVAALLSFAFPATFAAMVAPQIKTKPTVVAALVAAVTAVICYLLIPGKTYIIAGCFAGSLTGVLAQPRGDRV
ncbi:MAG TPA: AzlC family ABC transporter permease [Terriglobales bacterium]|nr:AzlC family ABC transporter permease [Terriglobales bacterium]